ncbi:MAG: hypothetical protein E7048_03535 [Lentisphaerae bacterium]|nr:hypothetical protein [Lentisphaerota bacterium]
MRQLLSPQYPASTNCSVENPEFLVIPGIDESSDNVHVLFRREIIVESKGKITFFIASCGHYSFNINGFYGIGPVRSTDSRIFYDSYDLTEILTPGINRIEVELHYPGSSYRTIPACVPALWVQITGAADAPWEWALDCRHQKAFEYTFQLGKCENRDDRKNNFSFAPATVALNPNGVEICPRPIPALTNDEIPFEKIVRCGFLPEFSPDDDDFAERLANEVLTPDAAAFNGSEFAPPPCGYYGTFAILDLGKEFYGNVEIEIESDESLIIDRAYDEVLTFSRVKARYAFGKWIPKARHAGDSYRFADRRITLPGKNLISVSFADRGGRFVEIAIRNHTKAVKVTKITAIDRIYPVQASHFACDDPFFNRLDEMCAHTVRHCVADTFVDCPWREQAFWVNDVEVSGRYYLLLGSDPAILEHVLQVALDGRKKYNWLPAVYPAGDSMPFLSIPAIWVLILYDCYLHTGNKEFVEKMLPKAVEVLNDYAQFTDESSLVPEHPSWWNFIDLAYVNAKSDLQGHTAVLNALIAAAWRCVARMGNNQEAEEKAQKICSAMKKYLWDESDRMFRDSDVANHGFELRSAHPAAILLCYDLMPELFEDLSKQLYAPGVLQPEPYYQRFSVEAALKTGQTDKCEQEIRQIWAEMVNSDSPTVWELSKFGPRPDSNTANSCCHAFSAAPMWYCRRVMAGIRPVEPGFKTFECHPLYKGDFHCIQPTPYGNIEAIQKSGKLTVNFPDAIKRV